MVTFLILKLIFREINNKKSVTGISYDTHILLIESYTLNALIVFNLFQPLKAVGLSPLHCKLGQYHFRKVGFGWV